MPVQMPIQMLYYARYCTDYWRSNVPQIKLQVYHEKQKYSGIHRDFFAHRILQNVIVESAF